MISPRHIANAQLVAYNAHDLAAFMALFADGAWLGDLPSGQRTASGKAAIEAIYRDRFSNPQLHCTVHARMDIGDFAIDHETVTGLPSGTVDVVAIYEVRGGLIQSVRFIRQPR